MRITYIPNRVIDINGIADGASVYVYQTGTTTPVSLYSDAGYTVPVTNPYVVAAGAEVPPLYTNYGGNVRLKVVSANGTVTDEDPYSVLQTAGFPALTGDVTNTAGALATTISSHAVTYPKFQQVASARLVGNPTGALADISEISLAGGLGFSGTALTINGSITAASSIAISGAISSTSGITSSSATAGVGYSSGARGTVTQITSKSTGVTLNNICGDITMQTAALAAGAHVQFTLTNSSIAANDNMILNHVTTGTFGAYLLNAHTFAAGSCVIDVTNISAGSLSEAIVLRYTVLKGG